MGTDCCCCVVKEQVLIRLLVLPKTKMAGIKCKLATIIQVVMFYLVIMLSIYRRMSAVSYGLTDHACAWFHTKLWVRCREQQFVS